MAVTITNDAATTRTNLGLGDAATKTVGTAAGNIPVLDGSGDLAASTYTDTVYTHPTTAGNKHIPTAGAADQVLTYSASGTATWADAAGGKVIAIKTTVMDTIQTFGSMGVSYHAVTALAVTITPNSSSSKFYITCSLSYAAQPGHGTAARIYRNGVFFNTPTSDGLRSLAHAASENVGSDGGGFMQVSIADAPSSTSALTYQLYVGQENPTATMRVGTAAQGYANNNTPGYPGRTTNIITIFEYED